MRKLTDDIAAIAARSAVIALEGAWLVALFAASLAVFGAGDAVALLELAAALALVFAVCAVCAAGGVAMTSASRLRR